MISTILKIKVANKLVDIMQFDEKMEIVEVD